jgi:hypothetical protein
METSIITTLVQTVPSATAVVITVILFLRFLEAESTRDDHIADLHIKQLERIGDSCHAHTNDLNLRTIKAIDRAANIIEDNTKIICIMEKRLNGYASSREKDIGKTC